ncbi:MAG: hypothetical protein NTZ69_05115 [Bacteroidia bacterium]|nr:hypothetical protein [Bacteroidia bacterium]
MNVQLNCIFRRQQIASRSCLPDEKSGQAAVAMTDHFLGGEGGEKEAGVNSAITEN